MQQFDFLSIFYHNFIWDQINAVAPHRTVDAVCACVGCWPGLIQFRNLNFGNNSYWVLGCSFDEFLMDLKQSKRKNIRQERKKVGASSVS